MRNRIRRTVAGLIAATLATMALLLAPAAPAAAHNTLQAATPTKDARLTKAPTTVTLRFMQKLNPAFTTIALSDATKRRIPVGEPTVSGTSGRVTVDEPLPNGTYTVAYRVVSTDGHPVQGSYRFTVADPTSTASPEATAPATSAAPVAPSTPAPGPTFAGTPAATGAETGDDRSAGLLLVGGGLFLAAVVAALLGLLRRRSARSS